MLIFRLKANSVGEGENASNQHFLLFGCCLLAHLGMCVCPTCGKDQISGTMYQRTNCMVWVEVATYKISS